MVSIRVMLADDQMLFVQSLKTVLEADADDIEVVAVAYDGAEAVRLAGERGPDLALMDVRMPVMDGVEAVRRINQSHPSVRTVMLTTFDDDEYVHTALRYGAVGYLLKDIPPAELVASIRAINEGVVLMSPAIARRLAERAASGEIARWEVFDSEKAMHAGLGRLSGREIEVLELIGRGMGNKQIAEKLYIAPQTVRNHISTIYTKLGVHDRYEAMQIAVRARLA
jgi:DNA-binding NarL/FixJ family response regulator